MAAAVRVLLGISEARNDVDIALTTAPRHFLVFLSSRAFAHAIAHEIVSLASAGVDKFPLQDSYENDQKQQNNRVKEMAHVLKDNSKHTRTDDDTDEGDIAQLVRFWLEMNFNSSEPARIGRHHTNNFQRLLYNVSASVVARCTDSKCSRDVWVPTLRRATVLLGQFAEGVKHWVPIAPMMPPCWSRWHALVYVLEMTSETIFKEGEKLVRAFPVRVFVDTIFSKILGEQETWTALSIADFKASALAWCACSRAWQYAAGDSCNASTSKYLASSHNFRVVVENQFFMPVLAMSRPSSPKEERHAKRTFESPESASRKAQRAHTVFVDQIVRTL